MLKKTFWVLMLAAPLSVAACDVAPDGLEDAIQENVLKGDPPKDEPKNPPKDEPKNPPKEEPKDPPKEEPRNPPKEEPKDPPKEEPKDPPKEEPRNPPKEEPKACVPIEHIAKPACSDPVFIDTDGDGCTDTVSCEKPRDPGLDDKK